MRVFMAGLSTETNTFSPVPTSWRAFEEIGISPGGAGSTVADTPFADVFGAWRRLAAGDGHDVIEGLAAAAQPAGPTIRTTYESLRDRIVEQARDAGRIDVMLLVLHGAMAAQGYDDCEGDLLGRLRAAAGETCTIGAELDLHCHLTTAMLDTRTLFVAYKEYPHIDAVARAAELYRLCIDAALGKTRPVTSAYDCKMVGLWRTSEPPVRAVVDKMHEMEHRQGILSASFGHGFPWGDVAEAGAKTWVIADGDAVLARESARELADAVCMLRTWPTHSNLSVDAALDMAIAVHGRPVILADVADNPGGGAPGDSTFVLQRLIERGIKDATIGCIWDPVAVDICRDAGVGAELDLRIGGKLGASSGAPVDVRATVNAIRDNHVQTAPAGEPPGLGDCVWINSAGVNIVICSVRNQIYAPDAFADLGIDVGQQKLVILKSTEHFRAGFASIAADIFYVDSAGALRHDFRDIPYLRRDSQYWPRCDLPPSIVA